MASSDPTKLKEARKRYEGLRAQKTLEGLTRNGFQAFYAETRKEAVEKVLELVPKGSRVGVGGSVTLREIGALEALTGRGDVIVHHWRPGMTWEEDLAARREELNSDVFLSSANAITVTGKLINADGVGNRVAAMIFGPGRVVVVAGVNKIVGDVEEGLRRIRSVAAPMNSLRMGSQNPCVTDGICDDEECEPPSRHCHVITIIEKKPQKTDFAVVLVGETLGY